MIFGDGGAKIYGIVFAEKKWMFKFFSLFPKTEISETILLRFTN
jgi:hypothetical protein